MKKKYGFTLIELLAVIVVLGIIATIAVPIVLNLIESSRKGAAEQSTISYVKAIETEVVASTALNEKEYVDKDDYVYDEIKVDVSGTYPTGGLYSLKTGTVTNGVFCVNGYEVEYLENKAEAKGKCTGEDLKLNGSVKLSETSGYYTYPNSGTIEVIENISEGNLNCTSSDENVAKCSITGTIVTVTPGTKEGVATLTITSESTSKYKEASVAYVVTTEKGLLSYTATEYNGIYDGEPHGITVEASGAIITYGTGITENSDGTKTLIGSSEISPTRTDAGTTTVYYQIEKAGYTTVTGSKDIVIEKAEGKIELEETTGEIQYNQTKEVEIKENESNGNLTVEVSDTNIVEASVENNKLVIKGKKLGTTTITVISEETSNYNRTTKEYTVKVIKANNTLKLSASSGTYTYPKSGTFEVIENTSGGKLSCSTSNSSVATCEVTGTTVTVTPGTTEGTATLTIKSASTTNYNAGQEAYVAITAKGTLTSYTATGYSGIYDGEPHGITVTSSGATIKYGTTSGSYTETTSPKYANVGTYTVYYQIDKAGYNIVTGSKDIVITKAEGSVTAPEPKILTYTGSAQELVSAGSSTTGEIQYKLDNGTYSTSIPTATNPGTYTVYYQVIGDSNHNNVNPQSISVTINKAKLQYTAEGYSGIYDGEPHSITVISNGATIKYGETSGTYNLTTNPTYTDAGTYTVYYQITREGYIDVTGSKTVIIEKANNTLTLSSNTGTYTYPTSGTFTITKNTSGGALSCSTSNTAIATCSISGTTVTVKPGTTKGTATLTITSETTTNYNSATASHVATTEPGILTVTVNPYSGTYDGNAHSITVTSSGSTITYSESKDGTYNTTKPEYTDAGVYTTYYKVEKAGYTPKTGSATVTINKASGSLSLSATSGSVTYGSTKTFTASGNTGTLSVKSSDISIATVSISGATVTITGVKEGTATITVTSETSTNYNSASKTYTVSVTPTTTAPTVTQSSSDARSLVVTNKQANSTSGLTSTTLSYGYSTSATGTYTWQTSNTFSSLVAGTTYYFKTKLTNSSGTETISNYTSGKIAYTGIPTGTYNAGDSVTYAGVDWYVIKDNGDNVTLITKSNIGTGNYGNTIDYDSSNAKTTLESWFNSNSVILNDFKVLALVADSSTGYYVRLPRSNELSTSIPNASGTTFWTMTSAKYIVGDGDFERENIVVGSSDGHSKVKNYTIKSGVTLQTIEGVIHSAYEIRRYATVKEFNEFEELTANPVTNVLFVSSIKSEQMSSYYSENEYAIPSYGFMTVCSSLYGIVGVTVSENIYYPAGDQTCKKHIDYKYINEFYGPIGYRPVITVKEK